MVSGGSYVEGIDLEPPGEAEKPGHILSDQSAALDELLDECGRVRLPQTRTHKDAPGRYLATRESRAPGGEGTKGLSSRTAATDRRSRTSEGLSTLK